MDNRVKEIEELIKLISKFPGLGPKSARRVALHLLKNKDTIVKPLSQSLTDVYNKVVRLNVIVFLYHLWTKLLSKIKRELT